MKSTLVCLTALALGLWGCSKKEDAPPTEAAGVTGFGTKSQSYPTITCWNGMLHFATMDDVRATLAKLESAESDNLKAFVALHGNLDEEAFNRKVEEEAFVEEQPLMDFEDRFACFSSLRKKIAAEEAVWLANETLDEATDPDNHYIDDDHARTILNEKCQIRIGDSVYVHYEKCNGAYHHLAFTGNETADCAEEKGGVICKSQRRVRKWEKNPSNDKQKAKMVVSHWTYVWDRYTTAKVKNYKKKTGTWQLYYYKQLSSAKVYGFISDNPGDCSKQLNFNPSNWSTADYWVKKMKHQITVQTLTSSGWVKGNLLGTNGELKTLVLTFNN